MRKARFLLVSLTTFLSLTACGDHLGNYQIEEVRMVSEMPRGDEEVFPDPLPYREFIRIELSSSANLNRMETGPGLYTDADFCPIGNRNQIIVFGPLGTDGHALENWRRTSAFQPSEKDGRFHYFVYVVPKSPARKRFGNSPDLIPAYDVWKARRPICLRFFVAGYNLVKSRSDVVELPGDVLQRALRN